MQLEADFLKSEAKLSHAIICNNKLFDMCTQLENDKFVLRFDLTDVTTKNQELTVHVDMLEQQVESLLAARVASTEIADDVGGDGGETKTQKGQSHHNPLQVSIHIIS